MNEELFSEIFELFPFPIQVFAPDGTAVYTNRTFFRVFKISPAAVENGRLNILREPHMEKWGIRENIERAFRGETVSILDIKIPSEDILIACNGGGISLESYYPSIYMIPIYSSGNSLSHVAAVFVTSRSYRDREEIRKSKEYIENHWLEKFDIDEIAGAVSLSKYHFSRLFKKHTGMTPYGYYQEIKVHKLTEKLCDTGCTVSQAFSDCGLNYSGNYAKVFREKVGMTPSQYKASVKRAPQH